MKAVVIHEFGDRNQLKIIDLPVPEPGEGEVLIRVKAAGINPVDWKIRMGRLRDRIPHQFPLILGWDVAGIVEKVGHGARRFQPGDEIYSYCRRSTVQHGSYTEYMALPECYLAKRPSNISFEEAAAIPLVGLTAYQSVYTAANLQANETLLVVGASGGVGSCAMQLGKIKGANVIGVASQKNHDYLKQLGANETIGYENTRFSDGVKALHAEGVDVIFDCVGKEACETAYDCAKQGGRFVSILEQGNPQRNKTQGIDFSYVFVEPNVRQLEHLTELVENGQFRMHVDATYSLEEVAKAHEQIETLHTKGKIVLTV